MVNLSKADKFDGMDTEWTNKMVECPMYHPSKQQFQDPFAYLQTIAPEASNYGIFLLLNSLQWGNLEDVNPMILCHFNSLYIYIYISNFQAFARSCRL